MILLRLAQKRRALKPLRRAESPSSQLLVHSNKLGAVAEKDKLDKQVYFDVYYKQKLI